eukprot:5274874-Alexandrium_andersonii.AAC.1
MSLRGVLARVLGQETFPGPAMPARTSEEEFKQAISDLGYYVDAPAGGRSLSLIHISEPTRLALI